MPDTCPPGDGSFDHAENMVSTLTSPSNHAPRDNMEGIEDIDGLDPDFLEAMPEDIRREIISNHILHQSARNSQAPQTRSRGRPSGTSSGPQPAPDETPQPKKRGRKKKEHVERVPLVAEETGEQSGTAPTPTTKRKRGRPKKGDAVQPPVDTESDELASKKDAADFEPSIPGADLAEALPVESAEDVVEAPKAPSKRGRKKKAVNASPTSAPNEPDPILGAEETARDTHETSKLVSEHHADDTVGHVGAEDEREALRDISITASQNASNMRDSQNEKPTSRETEKQHQTTPEPKAKDLPRSASTTGQQGKVPLRVGLSKKSKITPLLKMIRK